MRRDSKTETTIAPDGKGRWLVRLWWTGRVVLAGFVFAGCDAVPAARAAGVTLGPEGTPELLYVLCPGQLLEEVQLVNRVGDSPFDGDDDILWEIVSREGSRIDEIQLGAPPPGFTEEVPLGDDLTRYPDLVAVFESTTSGVGVAFDLDELTQGRVLMHDGSVEARRDFEERASSRCP